jgi:transcriptional regulator with XRE-family HTH domain
MRDLRLEHGKRQEDVAGAAKLHGLEWSRSTVNALERGARELALEEFLVLPEVLWLALGGVRLTYGDLLPPTGEVRVGDAALTRDQVAMVFSGELLGGVRLPEQTPAPLRDLDAERRTAERLGVTEDELTEAAYRRWGRGLTAERDHRLAGLGDAPPRTVQARRGHITRRLLEELRPVLREGRDGAR